MRVSGNETGGQKVSVEPLVSVIIPTHNDVVHLVEAVRSVLLQTLQNVQVIVADDHSTDSTPAAIKELMEEDSRVEYLRLPQNTGGAGAPRNRAFELVRAPYVMYLDSDDVLDRHACKNLYLAAVETAAEVIGGLTVRKYQESGRLEKWYGHLYQERRVFDVIDDFPELSHDTLITNKLISARLIRRELLVFPEDMHYEDVVFAAQLYVAARGFVLIPEMVYQWNVYPNDVRQSITNQRNFRKNLDDRLRAIDAVQTAYSGHSAELQYEIDQKVLTHHLRLYLNDLEFMSEAEGTETLRAVATYAERAETEAFDNIRIALRLLYAAVFAQNLPAALEALLSLQRGSFPGVVIEDRESGASIWTPTGKGSELVLPSRWEWLVDFSGMHIMRVPHSQFAYHHSITSVTRVDRSTYRVTGEFRDPLGKIDLNTARIELVSRTIPGLILDRREVQTTGHSSLLQWEGLISAPRRRGLSDREGRTFDVRIELQDGAVSTRPVFSDISDDFPGFKDASAIGEMLGDYWVLTSEAHERVELQIRSEKRIAALARGSNTAVVALKRGISSSSKWVSKKTGTGSAFGQSVIYPAMRRFPLRSDMVFFESNLGLSANDNPYAVYRELKREYPDKTCVWSLAPGVDPTGIADDDQVVRRKSFAYYWTLARAGFIVDNQSLPAEFMKREGQRYLQTWHGIPLKKMGKDEPRHASEEAQRRLERVSSMWDLLNTPSPYFESTFVPAYGYSGELIRYGSPRNDELVHPLRSDAEIRRALDVPSGLGIMLYAPTFRESQRNRSRAAQITLDLEAWAERYADDHILLVRSHYMNRFVIPGSVQGAVIDVSNYPNIAELYQVSDVLITDYSSVMFDFALLNKPIVIFAPDYEEYVGRSRGVYFNLRENSPGRFVESVDELGETLDAALRDGVEEAHMRFVKQYCGVEDGSASRRSVAALLGRP